VPLLRVSEEWGLRKGLSEKILAFLAFRPTLLHSMDAHHAAWPSPRSWSMADSLIKLNLSIEPAVGPGPSEEFNAFCSIYENLPDLESILDGIGKAKFPIEPSARYATVLGLLVRADSAERGVNALQWLIAKAGAEWVQFYASDLFRVLRERGQFGDLVQLISGNSKLKEFSQDMRDLAFSI